MAHIFWLNCVLLYTPYNPLFLNRACMLWLLRGLTQVMNPFQAALMRAIARRQLELEATANDDDDEEV